MKRQLTGEGERGAVSLFVVIFTALIVTVMTVSFIRLMIDGQRSASDADLSRSALDSAQAGVEDAKRALVKYRSCLSGSSDPTTCASLVATLPTDKSCQVLQNSGIVGAPADKEVIIKQSDGDEKLQQAYTCVKVEINSDDYIGTIDQDKSRIIPLRGVSEFNQIRIKWFTIDDLANPEDRIDLPALSSDPSAGFELPKQADWPSNQPALMRTQLIQYGDSFTLDQFDKSEGGDSNSNTLFLYPDQVGAKSYSFLSDGRRSASSGLLRSVTCDPNFSKETSATTGRQYACETIITLPKAIGASSEKQRTAYLNLMGLYRSSNNFKIELLNSSGGVTSAPNVVKFGGVQAVVDSTGRANDKFRRVESRVELDANTFQYPTSTSNTSAGFCKNFFVTDAAAEYVKGDDDC
ncbi:hypothetical protein I8H84_03910 [Candidatus Saccharibacteria bacterium]|nr:hypothetical protein [Candidatus Saccharibacteria bacterium]MBH1973081.1 hypothetical protein [Candidatus Saccharibacteria bacterium]MBH1990677.1 hypothetical protein [Candidatus Saccharibacteria bacterium]